MKKPYDYTKDYTFRSPAIVRTSNVCVGKQNIAFIRDFFSDLMEKNSVREVMCFVRKVSADGAVAHENREVSPDTFGLKVGATFKYVHTIGVSERIIVNEDVDGGFIQSIYAISG